MLIVPALDQKTAGTREMNAVVALAPKILIPDVMKTSEEILEEYKQAGMKRRCDLYCMFIDLRSEFDKMNCKFKSRYKNILFPRQSFKSAKGWVQR